MLRKLGEVNLWKERNSQKKSLYGGSRVAFLDGRGRGVTNLGIAKINTCNTFCYLNANVLLHIKQHYWAQTTHAYRLTNVCCIQARRHNAD
jgi:hypothetical protein